MKKIIAKIYLAYDQYFPLAKGKAFLGKWTSRLIGAIPLEARLGPLITIFIDSTQDKHLLRLSKKSDDETLKAVYQLEEGNTFIDIGANIGFFSLLASKKVAETGLIICFEPSFREYKRLLANIELNKSHNNFLVFNAGISKKSKIEEFAISLGHTGLNKIASGSDYLHYVQKTPIFSLDNLLKELNLNITIDLVKIDVEGAEFWVLEGMHDLLLKNKIKKIVIEITPKFLKMFDTSKEDIYNLMTKCGYVALYNKNDWQYDEVFVPFNKTLIG